MKEVTAAVVLVLVLFGPPIGIGVATSEIFLGYPGATRILAIALYGCGMVITFATQNKWEALIYESIVSFIGAACVVVLVSLLIKADISKDDPTSLALYMISGYIGWLAVVVVRPWVREIMRGH